MLASLILIGAMLAPPEVAVVRASQMIVGEGAEGMSAAINRMVGGIVSYVSWPGRPEASALTLCQIGTPRLAGHIDPEMTGRHLVSVRRTTAGAAIAGDGCDILFLGRVSAADRLKLIEWVRHRPVLTITDDDPACLYGAMFCLASQPDGLSFLVNLDAIGRSTLRVDPRVLKIGGGKSR